MPGSTRPQTLNPNHDPQTLHPKRRCIQEQEAWKIEMLKNRNIRKDPMDARKMTCTRAGGGGHSILVSKILSYGSISDRCEASLLVIVIMMIGNVRNLAMLRHPTHRFLGKTVSHARRAQYTLGLPVASR